MGTYGLGLQFCDCDGDPSYDDPTRLGEFTNGLELKRVAPPKILPAPLLKDCCRMTALEFVKSLTELSITEALL